MIPCPSCGRHTRPSTTETPCVFCGTVKPAVKATVAATLLGLTLAGCPTSQALYGTAVTDTPGTHDTTDTGSP
ncbi:MAG: hypothetical protein H6735_06690 [Alphaproteobacteria bacterium]|nr:hypothetical protein [Alphaproteobacteria bacterium]